MEIRSTYWPHSGSKMIKREFLCPIFFSSCCGKIGPTNWLKKVPSMEKMGLGGLKMGQNWQKKGGNEYLGSKMNMREFLCAIFCSSCRGKIESTNWLKKVPSMENLA